MEKRKDTPDAIKGKRQQTMGLRSNLSPVVWNCAAAIATLRALTISISQETSSYEMFKWSDLRNLTYTGRVQGKTERILGDLVDLRRIE